MAKKKLGLKTRLPDPSSGGLPVLRIGIYARVSTERQAQTADGSIETQVDRLKRYIAFENERPNREYDYRLVDNYIDPGHSAKNLDRPDISRLQADIEAGVIDCVAVTKIDRITRSLADFVKLDAFFKQHGTVLISIDDKFDTSTAMGSAMQQLLIVFAELERQLTAERTGRQMLERATKGLFNGGYRRWGYMLNPDRRGVPLIDPAQKADILRIFRRYRDGGSLHDLQRWMHDEGIKRPRFTSRNKVDHGGTVPDVASLAKILSNEFYVGMVKHDGKLYDGLHEPLFKSDAERKLWRAVQEKLASRSPKKSERSTRGGWKSDAKHVFILNSILFCGLCGSGLTHDSGTGRDKAARHYYTCVRRRKHGAQRCACPSLPAEAIEGAILQRLRTLSVNEHAMKAILAKADRGKEDEVVSLRNEETRQRRKLTEVMKQIENFVDVVRSTGGEGFATIRAELAQAEKTKAEVESDLSVLRARIDLLLADQVPDGMILSAYQRLAEIVEGADPMRLAGLLPRIIKKIVWTPCPGGGRGGRYKMQLLPTPLIPESLGPDGAEQGGVGSHQALKWLPHLDSNQEPTD